jgi:hypothetical protein
MRILLKCPTRSRPKQVIHILKRYVDLANRKDLLGICVSCDDDDQTMNNMFVKEEVMRTMEPAAWKGIFFGNNKTKIEAVNADMAHIAWPWDIVVLVSDDMSPQVQGYDEVIRSHMMSRFPDTDGIVWVNDGNQGRNLNTLSILGRRMYHRFRYIYHPSYKSLFCDTEFTDYCTPENSVYIAYCLIRHEHPGTGFTDRADALYAKNQTYWNDDMFNYINRKTYAYDWSILIPTMTGREESVKRLLTSINEKKTRICPGLCIEICLSFDNKEMSIGKKRQQLMKDARGKYMSFIDDDDEVTDAYFEDAKACIEGKFQVCRLRGQIKQYTFTHSLEFNETSMAAIGEIFTRPPNHLNIMLTDAARFVPFNDMKLYEDFDWAIRLSKFRFFDKEYQSDLSRIHYLYNLGNREVAQSSIEWQRTHSVESMVRDRPPPPGSPPPPQEKTMLRNGMRFTAKGFVSK